MDEARPPDDVLVPLAADSHAECQNTLYADERREHESGDTQLVVQAVSDSAILFLDGGSRNEDGEGPNNERRNRVDDLSLPPVHHEVPVGGKHEPADDEPTHPCNETVRHPEGEAREYKSALFEGLSAIFRVRM